MKASKVGTIYINYQDLSSKYYEYLEYEVFKGDSLNTMNVV